RDALNAVVLERAPQVGTDPLSKGWVLPDQNRLDLLLEDRLDNAGSAGHRAERAVRPSSDAGRGEDTEDDSATLPAEAMNGVVIRLAGRHPEDVRLEARDLHAGGRPDGLRKGRK